MSTGIAIGAGMDADEKREIDLDLRSIILVIFSKSKDLVKLDCNNADNKVIRELERAKHV